MAGSHSTTRPLTLADDPGRVAQSVERRSDKAKVLGSSPSMTTTPLPQGGGEVAEWSKALRSGRSLL